MSAPRRHRLAAIAALVWLAAGCTFSRTVTNESMRDLDVSFIKVGETTWLDVVRELGPPDPIIREVRQLTYTARDRRSCELRIGPVIYFPFEWFDEQRVERLMIDLNEEGVVIGVYRSWRDGIRPPFQSSGNRGEGSNQVLMEGEG